MVCPSIITGDRFLTRVLVNIDCQAQAMGSYGFQALAEPGSLGAVLMSGLLTLFVAFFGIRLLFGPPPGMRDVVMDVLKIGIVLTLAFSWPAFRTVIHDVVIDGPASIAARISGGGAVQPQPGLAARLQATDDALLELTRSGTGRNTGALLDAEAPGGTFASTALGDESGFGWSRLLFLTGTIGSYGLLRLLAGLLLALTPLAAGLLLFEQTRGLFSGWLRGLVLALIGMVGATVVLGAQLAAIGPWLADALRVRQLGYATPAAPTELLALTLGFAAIQIGMLAVLARVAFTRGWISIPVLTHIDTAIGPATAAAHSVRPDSALASSRAARIADTVENQLRREEAAGSGRTFYRVAVAARGSEANAPGERADPAYGSAARLGSSYRRTATRRSAASDARGQR